MPERITLLGSTGSIGQQTLDVIARHADKYQVHALTAHSNDQLMLQQCLQFLPTYVVMTDEAAASRLSAALTSQPSVSPSRAVATSELNDHQITVLSGADALLEVVRSADTVMAGIVGAAGLLPTLAAVEAGKRVLLANKEPFVMAGRLFMLAAEKSGATILPVDSEHNAIFQSMPAGYRIGERAPGVERLILTASGGPFRDKSQAQLKAVTPAQAVNHPNWTMGAKISIDSATMMNKGLEVIEAHWLFNMPINTIDVVIHPQSIIHSIVAYEDGSMLSQMGAHDMRIPISSALSWPSRTTSGVPPLTFNQFVSLDFQPVDLKQFPCLDLAYQAMSSGTTACIVLNAANEVAVSKFLKEEISYLAITTTIEHCLTKIQQPEPTSLSDIIAIDQATRQCAEQLKG